MSRKPGSPTTPKRFFPALLLAIWAAIFCPAGPASAVVSLDDLTGPWVLFVDDYPVAGKSNVTRTYHPFTKYAGNPVLLPTEPWEEHIAYIYGTVMPNETSTGYRMWYHTMRVNDPNDDGSNILYAESTNGVTWTKPILNIRSWHGSTANNMIFVRPHSSGITSVMHTPWDLDPNKKYRLMNIDTGGYWGAYSNDGVHTFDLPNNPVLTQGGDVGQFMFDPHTGLYRGYVKLNTTVNGLQRRSLGLSSTTEIDSWPDPQLILEVDSVDDRWVPPGTVQRTHIYGMGTFAYESMYMGLLWVFRATDVDGYYIGPVFTEIVSSHDGEHWIREEGNRPAMLPLGPAGEWDDGQLYTAKAPIVVGNELWVYYGACDDVHGTATKKLNCAIGLAKLRKDGFGSLDAGATIGTVTTKPILGTAGPLHVNYTATAGSLKVEVLDPYGNVRPGYSQADCNPLTGDSVDRVVTWTTHAELPGGFDPIALRFVIQNASVYSFNPGEAAQVINSPTIIQQPSSQTVAFGGTASFTVAAIGDPPLTYQWQKNGADLTNAGHYAGTTTTNLTVSNADSADAGTYRCVVANPVGNITSEAATLIVSIIVPVDFYETWDTYAVGTTDPAYVARWANLAGASRYPIQAWDEVSPPNTVKDAKEVALGVSHPLAAELAAALPGATEVRGTDADPLALLYQIWLNTNSSYATADVFAELSMGDVHAPTGSSSTVVAVLAFGLTAGLHGPAAYPRFFDGKNWNQVSSISIANSWNYFYMAVKDSTVWLEGRQSAGGTATLTRLYTGGFDRISFRTGFNTVQWRALGDVSLTGGEVLKPTCPADFDHDGDVDADDFSRFDACMSGPAIPVLPGCEAKDLDGDGDVDQADFGRFQRCYRGPGQPIDPDCAN